MYTFVFRLACVLCVLSICVLYAHQWLTSQPDSYTLATNQREMATSTLTNPAEPKKASSIFEFSAFDIDGNVVSLDKYRGFVTYIVNVASA